MDWPPPDFLQFNSVHTGRFGLFGHQNVTAGQVLSDM